MAAKIRLPEDRGSRNNGPRNNDRRNNGNRNNGNRSSNNKNTRRMNEGITYGEAPAKRVCCDFLNVGSVIDVSVIRGQHGIIGKYYPAPGKDGAPANVSQCGITCVSYQDFVKRFEVWEAEIIAVKERCFVVKYLKLKGTWGRNAVQEGPTPTQARKIDPNNVNKP